MAKMVNFGLAYGMSDFGLSSRAGISRQAAQEFINSYFAAYSGISYYMMHIKEIAREQGYVSTLFGRRRWIPELQARNSSLRGAGERMAINMPIQGTAADIVKIAMIRLYDRLHEVRDARPDPAPGPRRAAARSAAQPSSTTIAQDRARGDGRRGQARRAADGRYQEWHGLGVDDPAACLKTAEIEICPSCQR